MIPTWSGWNCWIISFWESSQKLTQLTHSQHNTQNVGVFCKRGMAGLEMCQQDGRFKLPDGVTLKKNGEIKGSFNMTPTICDLGTLPFYRQK